MRTPTLSLFACALLGALPGCPTSSDPDTGGGGVDTPPGIDAPDLDAGVDSPIAMADSPRPLADTPRPDDAPLLPPRDSGDPFGDTGPTGTPEWVDIDILTDGTMCPALVPCGGDVVGTWDVTGGCLEVPIDMAFMRCPGATVTSSGRARGRVTFDGTIARRVAQSEVTANVFVPGLCATFVGGCSAVQDLLQMRVPDSACAENAAGDCDCALRQAYDIDDGDAYTIMGNEIVSSVGGRRWEYCIEGDTLRYRDTTPGMGMREPGIVELGRVP